MKKKYGYFFLSVIIVILISGCFLGGITDVASGSDYIFSPPDWIQGTWVSDSDPNDSWTFTSTKVVYTYAGEEYDWGAAENSRIAGVSIITDETSSSTSFSFKWSSATYDFVKNTDTTMTSLGYKDYTKQ